jgi:hypothetical protein
LVDGHRRAVRGPAGSLDLVAFIAAVPVDTADGGPGVHRCGERAEGHLAGAIGVNAKKGGPAQVGMPSRPRGGLDDPPPAGSVATTVITPSPTVGAAGRGCTP